MFSENIMKINNQIIHSACYMSGLNPNCHKLHAPGFDMWFGIFLLMHTTIYAPTQSHAGLLLPLLKQQISLMKYSCTRPEHHCESVSPMHTHVFVHIAAHLCKGFYLMQNNGLITKFHQRLGSRESERSQPCTKSSN